MILVFTSVCIVTAVKPFWMQSSDGILLGDQIPVLSSFCTPHRIDSFTVYKAVTV